MRYTGLPNLYHSNSWNITAAVTKLAGICTSMITVAVVNIAPCCCRSRGVIISLLRLCSVVLQGLFCGGKEQTEGHDSTGFWRQGQSQLHA